MEIWSICKVLVVTLVLVFLVCKILRLCKSKSNPKHIGEWTMILIYKLLLRRKFYYILREYFKDEKKVTKVMKRMEVKLREVTKKIPYIGPSNSHSGILALSTALFVPMVMVLKEENVEKTDIEECERRIIKSALGCVPTFLFRLMSRCIIWNLKKVGKRDAQKKSKWEYDWCWDYLDGKKDDDGDDYMFQLRYTKCGILSFWKKLGIEEYLPAACSVDYAMFGKAGIKLVRTKTLSMGCDCCDFKIYGPVKDIEDLIPPTVDKMPDWKSYMERKMEEEEKSDDDDDELEEDQEF